MAFLIPFAAVLLAGWLLAGTYHLTAGTVFGTAVVAGLIGVFLSWVASDEF